MGFLFFNISTRKFKTPRRGHICGLQHISIGQHCSLWELKASPFSTSPLDNSSFHSLPCSLSFLLVILIFVANFPFFVLFL